MSNSENAIEVTNLVKRYKDLLALDHFSLTVKAGGDTWTPWTKRLRQNDNYKLYTVPAHI